MENNFAFFTAGEFAKIHHLNKRTLHYYDTVGIFSPKYKGSNKYRYYTYEQSIELENILALREVGMSIEEIQKYIKNPNINDFQKIAKEKITEIDENIYRLKHLKNILQEKSDMLSLCNQIYDGKIEIVSLNKQYLLMTKLALDYKDDLSILNNSAPIMEHLKRSWKYSNYKKNCGSYISIEKIKNKIFDKYDGIYTEIEKKEKNLYIKQKGFYVRGFCIGNQTKISKLYENILEFANKNNLELHDYAFVSGLNEFAISKEEEYITKIEIRCQS